MACNSIQAKVPATEPNPAAVLAKRLVKSQMPTYRTNGTSSLRRKQTAKPNCVIMENAFRQLSVQNKARLYNNLVDDMAKKTTKHIRHAVSSPRLRRKQAPKTCLIAESVFRQLSVKDKALVYNKLNDVITKKNIKSQKHAEVMEANVRKAVARGKVVYEKQAPVKTLVKEMDVKFPLAKHTISDTALKSDAAVGVAEEASKLLASTTPDKTEEEPTKSEHTISLTTLISTFETLANKADAILVSTTPAKTAVAEYTTPKHTISRTTLATIPAEILATKTEEPKIQELPAEERTKTHYISKLTVANLHSPNASIDQGFETASTDGDSPMRKPRPSVSNNSTSEQQKGQMEVPQTLNKILTNTHSQYWVRSDESTVMLEIFYNSPERVRSLYDSFCQKSSGASQLYFGIDNIKFTTDRSNVGEDITKSPETSRPRGCSHYWFANGDSKLLFCGKYICPDRVMQLFRFVSESFRETGCISFGVDNIVFSHIPGFVQEIPTPSIESSSTTLVGLESEKNNELNERNSNRTPTDINATNTSDLYHLESSSDEQTEMGANTTLSPLQNKRLGGLSFHEKKSNNTTIHKNETLHQLFEDAKKRYNLSGTQTDKLSSENLVNVPELLDSLLCQKSALKSIEECISNSSNSDYNPSTASAHCADSPDQLSKLRHIIDIIDRIERDSGFKASSKEQLESFMFFLISYANICLDNCSNHIEKIMDLLMDERVAAPPENELQKSHDHNPAALSEHQLRVQASLQRLNIPDWYRQYNQQTSRSPDGSAGAYKPGNFTRKRTTESGRWAGLNSKTTSLSSLGSQRSDRSPLLLSPSAHSHHGGGGGGGPNAAAGAVGAHQHHQHHGGAAGGTGAYGTGGPGSFSRWSTSHLNSSQTSPSVSQRGSFSRGGPVNSSFMSVASGNSGVIRNSFRQPYLGWRSTEKLSQRTPHERLATSMLAQQQRTSPTQRTANGVATKLQAVTPEIQTSIKEVTSAIVHYVNDQTQQQRSRSTSPNSRKCWLESSFVGTRPLDSPQTPVIESTTNTFSSAAASSSYNNNNNNNNNNSISSAYLNSSANSSIHSHILAQAGSGGVGVGFGPGGVISSGGSATANAAEVLRMNGLSCVGGAPERSLSTASLEDVLASLLGLPSTSSAGTGAGASAGEAYARSTTDGASASETLVSYQQQQQQKQQQQQHMPQQQQQQLLVNPTQAEQQRLRRRSEGDAPTKQQKQQQKVLSQQQQQQQQQLQQNAANDTPTKPTSNTPSTRRVSLGDSAESATAVATGNHASSSSFASALKQQQPHAVATLAAGVGFGGAAAAASGELPIKCRNTKCDRSASAADAKKHYKSCHNCTHLYCTRECRRAHWEKHRKACLHARASNLCRQVLATCKDDLDSQRHLSVLARKGYLSQGRGVVRVLFRSAESAEGFIKHGFQCMGEASYVRWPDLMPAEMGLELYSELLKLSTEYKPDSKMLIYVAICVVSEAPGMGQAPVRWERQLVSRCAKLKLCKTVLGELDQQQAQVMPLAVVAVPEPTTEILILTFNPALRSSAAQRELILSNILDILSRRGVLLRKHYPEIYQRLQSYSEGQTDKFNPVTLHPRDSHSGQGFVCIIMPVHSDSEIIKLPSAADGGNRVTTIDVGSPAALAQFDDDELLTRSTTS